MLNLVFLVVYGLYCFFRVNRAKSVPWMVANVAFLAAMGFLCWFDQNLYLGLGALAAVASVVYSAAVVKLPVMTNKMAYVKMFLSHLLFYPVEVFEEVYNKLGAKLSSLL